jgi:hypothetical protein
MKALVVYDSFFRNTALNRSILILLAASHATGCWLLRYRSRSAGATRVPISSTARMSFA